MNKILTKRNISAFIILAVVLSLGIYFETRPRIAPGQDPLVNIQNIETLRTQFNKDAGKTRLIILVAPT